MTAFSAPFTVSSAGPSAGQAAEVLARRRLQLALAVIWLLDGVLQYQPFMFSRGFPLMLAGMAQGNPRAVAAPITWSATIIGHHLTLTNTAFATIQVAIGLGIAFRPTTRAALATSIAWAASVWWLGEGLGGVLTSTGADPLTGAPGAVILYAMLAVMLWPAPWPVVRVLWLVLWGSEAVFACLPGSRIHGLVAAVALAVACAAIAATSYLPAPAAKAGIVAAVLVSTMIWWAEDFGQLLTGTSTDVNSGPVLALIALAFWPETKRSGRQPADLAGEGLT